MALEWLRRQLPKMDEMFRTYLFTEEPIVKIEESDAGKGSGGSTSSGSSGGDLGIRKLDRGD